jgi:hypothetical protein
MEMYNLVVETLESREKDLILENSELRQTLHSLYLDSRSELNGLMGIEVTPDDEQQRAREEARSKLPFHLIREDIQSFFQFFFERIRDPELRNKGVLENKEEEENPIVDRQEAAKDLADALNREAEIETLKGQLGK